MSSNNSSKKKASATKAKAPLTLNKRIKNEIAHLASHGFEAQKLEEFAYFVINHYKEKDPKPLALTQLKKTIFEYFEVKNLTELKRSGSFKMAIDGMGDVNFSVRETWEKFYREFIGVLPEEDNQEGYGCINGINIFHYFQPWRVFNLDPQKATQDDIKKAYRELSKIYHPDSGNAGDSKIFSRINTMYKSISAEA